MKPSIKLLLKKLFGNTKDLELMDLFLKLTEKVKESSDCLNNLLEKYGDQEKREEFCFRIENLEKDGDAIVEQIISKLNEISLTSWISHEMASRLVHSMDQVLDGSRGVVRIMKIYELKETNNPMLLLGQIIVKGSTELITMMSLFCQPGWQKHHKKIMQCIKTISKLEHQGDELRASGLHALWHSDDNGQPLTKRGMANLKGSDEILKALETITDDNNHLATTIYQTLN